MLAIAYNVGVHHDLLQWPIAMAGSTARSSQKGLLNGCSSTILDKEDKRRYKEYFWTRSI